VPSDGQWTASRRRVTDRGGRQTLVARERARKAEAGVGSSISSLGAIAQRGWSAIIRPLDFRRVPGTREPSINEPQVAEAWRMLESPGAGAMRLVLRHESIRRVKKNSTVRF
jgi:hypothetical protein